MLFNVFVVFSENRLVAFGLVSYFTPHTMSPWWQDQASSSTPEGAKGLWLSWAPVGLQARVQPGRVGPLAVRK